MAMTFDHNPPKMRLFSSSVRVDTVAKSKENPPEHLWDTVMGQSGGRRLWTEGRSTVGAKAWLLGSGEASGHISGRERITDQVMTLQSNLHFILSSVSDHQEQKAFFLTRTDFVCCQLGLKSLSNENRDFDHINDCECPSSHSGLLITTARNTHYWPPAATSPANYVSPNSYKCKRDSPYGIILCGHSSVQVKKGVFLGVACCNNVERTLRVLVTQTGVCGRAQTMLHILKELPIISCLCHSSELLLCAEKHLS